jgi:hypothetical protein
LELYSAAMRGSSLKRKAGSIEKDTEKQWNQDDFFVLLLGSPTALVPSRL